MIALGDLGGAEEVLEGLVEVRQHHLVGTGGLARRIQDWNQCAGQQLLAQNTLLELVFLKLFLACHGLGKVGIVTGTVVGTGAVAATSVKGGRLDTGIGDGCNQQVLDTELDSVALRVDVLDQRGQVVLAAWAVGPGGRSVAQIDLRNIHQGRLGMKGFPVVDTVKFRQTK